MCIKCINCNREPGLNSTTNSTWVYDEIVTKFVLNSMLHHVGMSWIISSHQQMEYEINKTNHQDWLNKGPWDDTSICLKLLVSRFEDFITQARIDRYNLMCYLVAYDGYIDKCDSCYQCCWVLYIWLKLWKALVLNRASLDTICAPSIGEGKILHLNWHLLQYNTFALQRN